MFVFPEILTQKPVSHNSHLGCTESALSLQDNRVSLTNPSTVRSQPSPLQALCKVKEKKSLRSNARQSSPHQHTARRISRTVLRLSFDRRLVEMTHKPKGCPRQQPLKLMGRLAGERVGRSSVKKSVALLPLLCTLSSSASHRNTVPLPHPEVDRFSTNTPFEGRGGLVKTPRAANATHTTKKQAKSLEKHNTEVGRRRKNPHLKNGQRI